MQAISLFVVQMLELSGTLFLLSWNVKPQHDLVGFFKANKMSKERNWLLASALGFVFLCLLVFISSLAAGAKVGVLLFPVFYSIKLYCLVCLNLYCT